MVHGVGPAGSISGPQEPQKDITAVTYTYSLPKRLTTQNRPIPPVLAGVSQELPAQLIACIQALALWQKN